MTPPKAGPARPLGWARTARLRALAPAVLAFAPVEPDEPTARRWLEEELSHPEYGEARQTWLDRLIQDLFNLLTDSDGLPAPAGVLLVVLVVVVAGAVILLAAGPARRTARIAGQAPSIFAGAAMDAAGHRRLAEEHASAARWEDAVRERFRAIVRGLQERTLLDDRPGLTADEAAGQAGPRLPEQAGSLRACAVLFDEVSFGDRRTDSAGYDLVRRTDDSVAAARPSPAGAGGPAMVVPR